MALMARVLERGRCATTSSLGLKHLLLHLAVSNRNKGAFEQRKGRSLPAFAAEGRAWGGFTCWHRGHFMPSLQ
jgi:hypothetical protein